MSSVKIGPMYSVAELWIEFFEFYSLGFNVNDDVVSIRNVGGFTRDEKQWKGKKLAIEGKFFVLECYVIGLGFCRVVRNYRNL